VEILSQLCCSGLVETTNNVERPIDGIVPLDVLPIIQGFKCSGCNHKSGNEGVIRKHCRSAHGWSSGSIGRKGKKQKQQPLAEPYKKVSLQTLWSKKGHIDYFIVREPGEDQVEKGKLQNQDEWADIKIRYDLAQRHQHERLSRVIEQQEHVSELTPWLRQTGYHSHLQGLPTEEIPASYQLADEEDEPELAAICSSVDRVLRKSMAVLRDDDGKEERQLSRLNAKLINTFRGAEMSQDPIKSLQNSRSKYTYINSWQKLVCYFSRVTRDGHLNVRGKLPFFPTQQQKDSFTEAWEKAELLCRRQELEGKQTEGSEEEEDKLDQAVLCFSLALIQQRLEKRAFDSAMVSFAAISAWDSTKQTWREVNNYTSHLSQIIYDCQLLVLQQCIQLIDTSQAQDLTSCIVDIRDKWLLNDTPGPVAELSGTRLLGFEIGRNTVNQAQVRWHADSGFVRVSRNKVGFNGLRFS